jgi:sugar phosphate isomerase/epimerase
MTFYTRRDFGRLAFGALPALRLSSSSILALAQAKPNSKVGGVQIGLNVPYSFGGRNMDAAVLLKNCVDLGVSGLELRTQPVESFMGAAAALVDAKSGDTEAAGELRKWRLAAPLDKAQAFRKQYNDAGVSIEIVKVDGIFTYADAEIDYAFGLAKALGARAISTEIAADGPQRLGQFADKHGLMVGYHGHEATGPEDWEKLFAYAAHNGANLDIGHFVSGNHGSPVPFLKQHHDRITHIHVKDRKVNKGPNVPFGQGDTPIVEVLKLIRDNHWNIQATIEFEYPVPAGSDRMTEIKKSVDYCRAALS